MGLQPARWWAIRPARNLTGAVYTCPICEERLPALMEHYLIAPEGDASGRRHAHTECVRAARCDGRLVDYDQWLKSQPARPSLLRRLQDRRRRLRSR